MNGNSKFLRNVVEVPRSNLLREVLDEDTKPVTDTVYIHRSFDCPKHRSNAHLAGQQEHRPCGGSEYRKYIIQLNKSLPKMLPYWRSSTLPRKRRISTFPLLLLPSGQQMQLRRRVRKRRPTWSMKFRTRFNQSSKIVVNHPHRKRPRVRIDHRLRCVRLCQEVEQKVFPRKPSKDGLGMGVQSVSGGRLNWLGTETLWMSVNGSAQWEIFCGLRLSCWEHDNA